MPLLGVLRCRLEEVTIRPGETHLPSIVADIEALGREFRTPGHIPVCREAKGGLSVRQGHTELAVAVSRLAGCPPVVVGAEMLESDGDLALSRTSAEAWGRDHGVPFITGGELLAAVESEV